MKATTEMELKVSGGQILSAKVEDGVCRLLIEVSEEKVKSVSEVSEEKVESVSEVKEIEAVSAPKEDDDLFVCIKASELSLDDKFMQYRPKNEREQMVKDLLEEMIKKGIEDFWCPRMDPTLDERENICFKVGGKPAVGRSFSWWCEKAKQFNPKRKSRLGTKAQHVAFLGELIKQLIAEGWTVSEAWNAVCNDSERLVHYCNAKIAEHDFERTGSRTITSFYALSNVCKILAKDEDAGWFWLVGGYFFYLRHFYPLADLCHLPICHCNFDNSVGLIVLS